jgi:signal transduction histidine kinase
MRAPLRAMQSYSQFLVDEYDGKLGENGSNYLHQIMRSAVRLDHLIQDVLSYTKILRTSVPMGMVDLDRLVRDIVETCPNGQPIKPQIEIKGTLPEVLGNEALLTQCISNLLSNGSKFVAEGTTPRMEIWAEDRDPSLARLWFKDNGLGIAHKDHQRIFRMFERIYPANEYEGTGIGLSIVRKAVERMGAQVGIESELGKGSSFWIELDKGQQKS